MVSLFWRLIFAFPMVAKSLFPHVATRDIHIAKGSNYITTR